MREQGFYWIKVKPLAVFVGSDKPPHSEYPDWTPAYWTGTSFWLEDEGYSEDDCLQIHPHRIPTPDEGMDRLMFKDAERH